MPKMWKLVSVDATEAQMKEVRGLYGDKSEGKFPIGVLDNLPLDFLRRCQWSKQADGCVAFCYKDGEIPDIDMPSNEGQAPPTYKGMQPKRAAFIGKAGVDPGPGAVIRTTCGNRMCVNQNHLEHRGEYAKNQFAKRG